MEQTYAENKEGNVRQPQTQKLRQDTKDKGNVEQKEPQSRKHEGSDGTRERTLESKGKAERGGSVGGQRWGRRCSCAALPPPALPRG